MSLDFQQVRQDVKKMGEAAQQRADSQKQLRLQARELLSQHAENRDFLNTRVQRIVRLIDPNLRCALPARTNPEPLNSAGPLPELPLPATILAADGSQINPDRHDQVQYGLVNVGAICMQVGLPHAPQISIQSHLMYDEELYISGGTISEEKLALERDLRERRRLVELADGAAHPVITLTDGPMELWGAKDSLESTSFQTALEQYQAVLQHLCHLGVVTAGYVDKPAANLMVRLLEIASMPEDELENVRKCYPLQGVTDRRLFDFLEPGERSAVFAMQSRSAVRYRDQLALHFFYLNVGRASRPWLARVEIPAWVAETPPMLNALHAGLVQQCRTLGARAYPYVLHRAHEAAVVTREEKDQVTQMIAIELRNRGVDVDDGSHKQGLKDSGGRTQY